MARPLAGGLTSSVSLTTTGRPRNPDPGALARAIIGFPVVDWSTPVPQRQSLSNTSRSAQKTQVTCAALDALLRVIYGRRRVGALLANIMLYNNQWVCWLLWGEGPVDSIVDFQLNDKAITGGPIITHYLGDSSNSVNSTLVNALADSGAPGFSDPLWDAARNAGVVHTVAVIAKSLITGTPNFTATIRGRKLYDPRKDSTNGGSGSHRFATPTTWEWSDNPTLQAADYATNTVYGAGLSVDWPSVITCANLNDAMIGSPAEKHRLSDMLIETESATDQWMETFKAAAGIFIQDNQGVLKFIPDVAGSPVATYNEANGNIISIEPPEFVDATQLPTVCETTYTDNSSNPWKDAKYPYQRSGVAEGTTPYRRTDVQMQWITRGTQARRETVERNNKLWLRDLNFNAHIMDEGLVHEVGDIIAFTFAEHGWSSYKARVMHCEPTEQGWMLGCVKEDDNAYDNSVQAVPGVVDTTFPTADSPPVGPTPYVVEDVYQTQDGYWESRLIVTWDPPDFPFIAYISVNITQNGDLVDSGQAQAGTSRYVSKPLPENLQYDVTTFIVSILGTQGDISDVTSKVNDGKQAVPSAPTGLVVVDVGGETRWTWVSATDRDLTGHELKFGPVGGSYDTATLVARIATPQITYATRTVPAGQWVFYVKGLDSIRSSEFPFGQPSATASSFTANVGVDPNAFMAGQYSFQTPSLYKMVIVEGGWVSDGGTSWNSLFPNNVDTYTNVLYSYRSSAYQSMLVTEVNDFGSVITGSWLVSGINVTQLGADAPAIYLDTCTAGPETAKNITGATNATPISITSAGHAYVTGNEVLIANVGGNTAANGRRLVTVTDSDHYTLQDLNGVNVAGNGAYTTGGTSSRWVWTPHLGGSAQGDGRFVRIRVLCTDTMFISGLGTVSCSAATNEESGSVTSSSSGPVTVTLQKAYSQVAAILLTPRSPAIVWATNIRYGTDPLYFDPDYIDADYFDETEAPASSFDVYARDDAGTQIAVAMDYRFRGI